MMSKSAPSAALKRSARGKDVYLRRFGHLFTETAPEGIAAGVRGIFVWVLLVVSLVIGAGAATAQDIDRNVELSEDADPIPAGGTINYDVAVFNSGIASAPATTLEIQLPEFAQYTGSTGAITGCTPLSAIGPTVVTCNVPALASGGNAGASVAMVFSVVASRQGSITVVASLPATDLDNSNNTADETTTITQGADLELFVSGPAAAASGEVVSFVYTATNNGPNDVASATLQFPVPTGLGNVVAPAGCVETAGRFDCAITGPLAVGASVTRTFTAQISAASGSDVTTLASLTNVSPEDPVVANNNKSITTPVSAGSDLTLSKLRSPGGDIFVGDTVTFTLSPSFTGSTPNDITVSDSIPANYTIVSAGPAAGSAFGCSVTGQDVTCTLTSGGAAGVNVPLGDIEIVTTVASVGTPTNSAAITALGPLDPDPANNVANDGGATILEPSIDLSAIKDGSPLLSDGGTAVYRIGVTNVGTIGFFGTARMVDSIPAGLTVTSINRQGWTCPVTLPLVGPADITCELVYTSASPLVPGARTNLVALRGDVSGVGALSNSLTVSTPDGNTADTNAANDTITVGSVVGSAADSAELGVIKRALLPTLPVGDEQTFEIEVTNSGPQPSLDVTLTDNIRNLLNDAVGATNAGFISAVFDPLSAGSCSTQSSGATSRRLTCILPSVAVCTTGVDCPVLTVKVVPGGNAGSRNNDVNVTSATTPDPTQVSNNQFSVPYAVTARADVTLSKVGSPDPATAGQEITYVLTATNLANALSAAENVTVTDTLPDNLTFVSATPSSGTCGTIPAAGGVTGSTTTNDVICNLGTVNNGAQRTVTIVARANTLTSQGAASITNVASVSTTTSETDTTNNAATLTTAIQPPSLDLLVNKTDSVDPVEVGEDTVYTISVTNVGPSAAEDVVLTDTMPPLRLSFQSFTVDAGGACGTVPAVGSTGGTLICEFDTILSGATKVVTVTARGEIKGTGENVATVSSAETALGFDSNVGNETERENTNVVSRADVEVVSKTPGATPVDLREAFDFTIVVRNNTGALLAEADGVVLADALPAGMILNGVPSAVVTTGTASVNSCGGVSGDTSFSCSFGTMSPGAVMTVTVPVKVIAVDSFPDVIVNTATVTTTSRDADPSNDSKDGSVTVNSSSVAGSVYSDLDFDGTVSAGDGDISGVTMTLSGTAHDGAAILLTFVTDATGNYVFPFVPAGDYTITRGALGVAGLFDAANTVGSEAGATPTLTITTFTLPSVTTATGYLFSGAPQSSIGIAKQVVGAPTVNADGSFDVAFQFLVENFSTEPLDTIDVIDGLSGAAPLFGDYVTLAAPASDAMTAGSYTIATAPTGSCVGLNTGFNGDTSPLLVSGGTLGVGATCTINFALRVQPTVPPPAVLASGGRYENQASVTGEGTLSGQTSLTNPALGDLSDDGTDPDPSADGFPNGANENDPTPVALTILPGIEVVKTQSFVDDGDGLDGVGDTISYTITVLNTGDSTLTNVGIVSDTFQALDATPLTLTSAAVFVPSIGGSPEGTLIAGETATYSASFVVNVAAVVGGGMSNSVTVSGDPALGPPFVVTDISDDGDDGDGNLVDDPTVYPLVPSLVTSGLSVTKTTPVGVVERGSVVPYTISIANNTAVSVGLLTLVDVLPSGFLYVDGSATLAAVPFAVTVAGKVVTWPSISVAPFATLTATLSARITTGAQAGEHVNTASVRDPATGALLAPQATAVVRILPEPVFDCGDVIGKVFNDQNRDGYQNQGEAGIPAARVAGVDGTIITTDPFGRYHVPCAMLPQDRGSNFILKLDTRSLPAGYRVTTENPRVMRLTPGKMTEMNFGAAITRVVRVDLNGRAFVVGADGRAALSPALVAGIATLLPQIAAQPVNLRLAYHVPRKATSDDLRRGRALSRLVERHIERAWRDIGQVMLTIELTIVREEE